MITLSELKKKAEKKYLQYLAAWATGDEFTRLVIPCDKKVSDDFATFEQQLTQIRSLSKEKKGYGYSLTWQTIQKKSLGTQDIPQEIFFETEADLLKFLHKETEAQHFKDNLTLLLDNFPELREWAAQHPAKIIEYDLVWENLLKVLTYFRHTPQPHLYIRELPIEVHTKFVETHKGILAKLLDLLIPHQVNQGASKFEDRYSLRSTEPQVRLRLLDDSLSQRFFSGLSELTVPLSQLQQLRLPIREAFVVENEINFLTFPPRRDSLLIWGHGYAVANLQNLPLLRQVPLYYWGDLDAQGFEILSQMRGYFPQTQSLLMDKHTFDTYFQHDEGTPSQVNAPLHLTPEEDELYQLVKRHNWRLEQEKIPHAYVVEKLARNR